MAYWKKNMKKKKKIPDIQRLINGFYAMIYRQLVLYIMYLSLAGTLFTSWKPLHFIAHHYSLDYRVLFSIQENKIINKNEFSELV